MRLLFVESNTSGTGSLFCRRACERGFRPVLLTDAPSRYTFLSDGTAEIIEGNTADPDFVLRTAEQLRREGGLAGVSSTSEYYIETAARTAAALGLPGPPPEAVRTCRNKGRLAEVLRAAGVKVPHTKVARSPEEAASAAQELGPPVVIKPVSGSGSVGVRRAESAQEAAELASVLLAARTNERGLPMPAEVLVQAFVDGPEYSVESMGGRLVGVTAKHVGGPAGTFVESGHDFPAASGTEATAVARAVEQALGALAFHTGPAHTEVRLGPEGPVVIEVNPRLAGGFIPELVRHATGVDLIEATLSAITGASVDLAPSRALHASIRFVMVTRSGRFERLEGLHAARGVPGVVEVSMYPPMGARLTSSGDFRDRIGHVMAVAEEGAVAASAAARARDLIEVGIASDE